MKKRHLSSLRISQGVLRNKCPPWAHLPNHAASNHANKIDYLFVGQGSEEAAGRLGTRCVALHEAVLDHKIWHEDYVGAGGGHDWATWHHLLYCRFLPNLWRKLTRARRGTATRAEPDADAA